MDSIRAWLDDILVAIDEIEKDLPPVNDFNLYKLEPHSQTGHRKKFRGHW